LSSLQRTQNPETCGAVSGYHNDRFFGFMVHSLSNALFSFAPTGLPFQPLVPVDWGMADSSWSCDSDVKQLHCYFLEATKCIPEMKLMANASRLAFLTRGACDNMIMLPLGAKSAKAPQIQCQGGSRKMCWSSEGCKSQVSMRNGDKCCRLQANRCTFNLTRVRRVLTLLARRYLGHGRNSLESSAKLRAIKRQINHQTEEPRRRTKFVRLVSWRRAWSAVCNRWLIPFCRVRM
jgi:hypothetical protein